MPDPRAPTGAGSAGPGTGVAFTSVLASTMAFSTFSLVVFGVLASELIHVFGASRQQIGYLVTASGLVGAAMSPLAGPFADRFGARRATLVALTASGGSLLAVAGAPAYGWLLGAAALTGLAQAGGNPPTNKLIAERVPAGRRGVITGIKQSGVQVGVFLGGATLPPLTSWLGWRWAVAIFGLGALGGIGLAAVTLRPDAPPATPPGHVRDQWRPSPLIVRLAAYGLLVGAGASAVTTYLALFSEEVIGVTATVGGRAVALSGIVGIVARIGWGRLSEQRMVPGSALQIIALMAAATAVLLAIGPGMGTAVIWLAAIGIGASAVAWNAVGMLAIILYTPAGEAGRASGVVLAGFLGGVALGAPALGATVDALGDYRVAWSGVAVVFTTAWLIARRSFGRLPQHVESPG